MQQNNGHIEHRACDIEHRACDIEHRAYDIETTTQRPIWALPHQKLETRSQITHGRQASGEFKMVSDSTGTMWKLTSPYQPEAAKFCI